MRILASAPGVVAAYESPAAPWDDAEIVDGELVAETLRRHVTNRYLTCGHEQCTHRTVDVRV